MPNYVTASGFTEDIPNRTKVGDAQAVTRIGFQSLPKGDVKWLRTIDTDSLVANSSVVAWNDAGTQALVVGSSRNFKTRQLSTVDAATGTLKAVETLVDTAWVGGPCGFGCAGYYDGDQRVYWVSEASGYAQLWSAAADGSDRKALTSGPFEIYDVALSADKQNFLFHSSEVSPFDRDLWSMKIATGVRTRLTPQAGGHQVDAVAGRADDGRCLVAHEPPARAVPGEAGRRPPCRRPRRFRRRRSSSRTTGAIRKS